MGDIVAYRALASRVLCVATVNKDVGDWTAYCDAVPGMRHEWETGPVASNGDKLPKDIAEALFPREAKKYVWRK